MPQRIFRASTLLQSFLALALAVSSIGCSVGVPAPVPTQIERLGLDVVLVNEGQRAAFFKDGGTVERFCAAPEADVADVYGSGMSLGASEGSIDESVGFSRGESAVALGGRNPATLLTRELLYRACEMSLNIDADGPTTQAIYDRFLEAILKITAQQTSTGTGTAVVASTAIDLDTGSNSDGSDSESSDDDSSDDEQDSDDEDGDDGSVAGDDGGVAGEE